MGYIEDVRKVSGAELMFSLLFISGAICPGMLAIWNFSPTLIEKCGAVVFVLLSIALTLPILSINALVFITALQNSGKNDESTEPWPTGIAAASSFSMLTIGIPLLVAFLASFSLTTFVWSVIGAELLALVLCVCVGKAVTIRPDKKVKRGT